MKKTKGTGKKKMDKKAVLDKLMEVDEKLYALNAKVISLQWIGLGKRPTRQDISDLNDFIGDRIRDIREIQDMARGE